jgi:hypothetical protein
LAKIAYLDNPSPLAADMPCWLSDLRIVLASLPVPVTFPEGPTMSDVAEIRKGVLTACQQHHSKITKELAPRDAVFLFDIIERLANVFATCDALRPAEDFMHWNQWNELPLSPYLMFDVRAPWGLSDFVSPILSSLFFLVIGVWDRAESSSGNQRTDD